MQGVAVHVEGGQSHGAVDVHGDVAGQCAVGAKRGEFVEDDLGPVDREGGNDDGPAPRQGAGDHRGEFPAGALVIVPPVAVGRLHQQHVRPAERLGWQQKWVPRAAEVAADGEGVPVLQGQVGPGRAEDVAAVVQRQLRARHDVDLAAHRHGVEELHRVVDIVIVVERLGGPVLGPAVPVGVLGGLHLQAGAVTEHDLGEPGGGGGGQDRPTKAVPDQARQVPAVVQVGVRHDDRVDVAGVAGQLVPVAAAQVRQALEESAVDEDPGVVALDQELAAGHRPDTTEEPQQGGAAAGDGADRDMAAALLPGTGALFHGCIAALRRRDPTGPSGRADRPKRCGGSQAQPGCESIPRSTERPQP